MSLRKNSTTLEKIDCSICKSNDGQKRISPGKTIHKGSFWQVEHAYPCSLKGWLVIALREHKESLADLTSEEMQELTTIIRNIAVIQKAVLKCQKSYMASFGEKNGFRHLHVHMIPRSKAITKEDKGAKSFHHINCQEQDSVSRKEIEQLCQEFRNEFLGEGS